MAKEKIHFIGIGGVSQSKLALMLVDFGYVVSGSDREKSENSNKLKEAGVQIFIGHKAENVFGANIIVYNGAISDDNVELLEAKKLGIKLVKRSEMLAKISKMHKKCVAICGCHGKTTTTGLLAFALKEFNPQMHIGGNLFCKDFEVVKNKNLFVTEACEFQKSFLELSPDICVMLNIDKDHLDCYGTIEEIEKTFKIFTTKIRKNGTLIYNADDERCERIAQSFFGNKISFGVKNLNSNVLPKNVKFSKSGIELNAILNGENVGRINCKVFGKHNVYNILASVCVSICLKSKDFAKNLNLFCGVERRMEFLGNYGNSFVVHDYAHHPTEIEASINAVKLHFKKPIVAVFEPHTFSRTQSLWAEFSKCFDKTKHTFLLPIYSAREKPIKNITSKNLSKEIKNCTFIKTEEELKNELKKFDKCVILVMGAGSVEKIAHKLIDKKI